MEVMKPIQDRFVLICICPSKTNDPFIKIRNVVIAVLFFLIITCYGFGCACCIGKNFKTDFEGSLQATVIMSGSWALTYMMLASFFLRNQFTGLFGAFQNLYDKCNLIIKNQFIFWPINFFFSLLIGPECRSWPSVKLQLCDPISFVEWNLCAI